ncbi:Lrp/AsnC family transcriptional regulator [Aliivibrio fischeri]|uniref:Lrp/AsnC family transcriptional regulator n=1 Tax=Aliivibrio fischeri TaxID=668 RepID=UPI00080E4077|nr:Lrp/AsnC family transcriptional regulator [Aliivibrio fischeri]OCH38081.1 hypothetical protein A6E02_18165 [Aliivibrio fischeri]
MSSVDAIDQKIISMLKNDSRQSIQKIADAVYLSRSATDKRIKILLDEKVIKKFTIELYNENNTEENYSYLLIKTYSPNCDKIFALMKTLIDHFDFESTYGEFDCLIKLRTTKLTTLYLIKENLLELEFIEQIYILPVLEVKQ